VGPDRRERDIFYASAAKGDLRLHGGNWDADDYQEFLRLERAGKIQ